MMAGMQDRLDLTAPCRQLCRHWFAAAPLHVAAFPAPGFSGADVFRVERADTGERFVLKRFAASATPRHAAWVHALAGHLRSAGIDEVPRVCVVADRSAAAGGTLVADRDGAVWEMIEFKRGAAVESPTAAEAAAAAVVLARVHAAAARLPGWTAATAPSPGLVRRIERCHALRADPWSRRLTRLSAAGVARDAADPALALAVAERLVAAAETFAAVGGERFLAGMARLDPAPLSLQPVLRDVWCDHVLFADRSGGSEGVAAGADGGPCRAVSGIIDLHAAGIDTPAADLARLLGSWTAPAGRGAGGLVDRWPEPLAAYEAVRPIAADEREAIGVLHAAGVVASLDNWFRWILEEGRHFPSGPRVLARIDRLLGALADAVGPGDPAGRRD